MLAAGGGGVRGELQEGRNVGSLCCAFTERKRTCLMLARAKEWTGGDLHPPPPGEITRNSPFFHFSVLQSWACHTTQRCFWNQLIAKLAALDNHGSLYISKCLIGSTFMALGSLAFS